MSPSAVLTKFVNAKPLFWSIFATATVIGSGPGVANCAAVNPTAFNSANVNPAAFNSATVKTADNNDAKVNTYFNSDSLEKPLNLDIYLIEGNINNIRENIKTDTSILFFNDEPDLSARLLSLSDWIRSYIVSINYLCTNQLLKNTLTLQEILHDFSEIA